MRWYLAVGLSACLLSTAAVGDVLDTIAERGIINLGHRTDAAPFSFLDGTNRAAGFSVDLCRRIVEDIGKVVGKPVATKFVPVGANDRFQALHEGTIDLLCEASTVTLKRREQVDFTLMTFVTGTTFMTRASAAPIEADAGKVPKIGVLAKTTSETILARLVENGQAKLDVVPVDTHDVAIGFLMSDVLDGYFGDQELLRSLQLRYSDPSAIVVSTTLMTVEPYALAVRRGEDRLRLISDRTLAEIYRSQEIFRLIEQWFPNAKPSPTLRTLYLLQGLPEE